MSFSIKNMFLSPKIPAKSGTLDSDNTKSFDIFEDIVLSINTVNRNKTLSSVLRQSEFLTNTVVIFTPSANAV